MVTLATFFQRFLRLLEVVFAFVNKLLTFTTGSGNNEMVTATLISCFHQKAVVQEVRPLSFRLLLIKPTGVRYETEKKKILRRTSLASTTLRDIGI